jgi:hypothetical protein
MKKQIKFIVPLLTIMITLSACTDLEVEPTDSILVEEFNGLDDGQAESSLTNMYNNIYNHVATQENLYALSEVTGDALLIPTRGSDWGDNGLWRQLHQHSWNPDHRFITNLWNEWNTIQLNASEIIDERTPATPEIRGEAYFLRGLAMFIILDNYGQVPFRDTFALPSVDPEVFTGEEAVNFIVEDLNNAISSLPAATAGGDNQRATKTAAQLILAKVLLNKHIYTDTSVADADMNQVISLVNDIESDGFQIQNGYYDIFKETADSETILYFPRNVGERTFHTLHYNSTELGGGGWNGFATLSEYYDLYEGDPNSNRVDMDGNPLDGQEERRGGVPPQGIPIGSASDPLLQGDENGDGFVDGSNVGSGYLIGQQYAPDGSPLEDRNGGPLSFTRDFFDVATGEPSLTDNNEVTGIRVVKYNPRFGGGFQNHYVFLRYADAYLMKAEAMFRLGQDVTTMINDLRTLRNATPLNTVTEQDILDERARELFTESWRRNDLIRFGQYTRDWSFKDPSAVNNPDRKLFPIPETQINLNPNLVQNPGY